jgi:hypothetical protein
MSDDNKSAIESDSLTDETVENPTDEGKIPHKKSTEQLLEEYRHESKRKTEELSELRKQVQELLADKEDRLAELQDKARLTAGEKEEIVYLEEEISTIKRDKRAKPWLKLNEEISSHTAKSEISKYDAQMTEFRLKKLAKQANQPVEKFEKEIVQYMRRVDPLAEMPGLMRLEEAYDLYSEESVKLKELDSAKEKSRQFSDTGGFKAPRPQSAKEILDKAVGKERNDKDLSVLLKGLHDVQHEATSR